METIQMRTILAINKYKLISSLYLEFIQIAKVSAVTNETIQLLNTQVRKRSH